MAFITMTDLLVAVMNGITMGLGLMAVVLLFPCLMLLAETMAAVMGRGQISPSAAPLAEDVNLAVLVPAHNEAAGIRSTLESIARDLRPQDQLVVVADNCTDDTAAIAREAGATVIERYHTDLRGKGYALDYGLNHLKVAPPDVVVLMDADCDVDPGSLPRLACQTLVLNRPVQANYLIQQPATQNLKGAVSAFAVKVKNYVRPLGLLRLGAPCLLTGTGIALPWRSAIAVNVASGHIVEDMKWGLDLALQGHLPIFFPQARVTSRLPSEDQAAKVQRTRWEHGHLQILTSYTPRLLWQGLRQGNIGLLALALELSILPLSLLVMVWVGVMMATVGAGILGGPSWPLQIAALAGGGLFLAVLLAWVGYGRSDLRLAQLVMVPVYILWKIPLYIMYMLKPQKQWVRTQRDSAE
jgi:cellulose synthase/poly-beta-1,6-N-acetylglucosamine synthase-like glycosyltransferase